MIVESSQIKEICYKNQVRLLAIHQRLAKKAIVCMVPAENALLRSILFFNREIRGKTGSWADEELFSEEVLKQKFPACQFQAFKDPFFRIFFWFGCQVSKG